MLKVKVTEKDKGAFVVSPQGSIDTDTYSILEKEVEPILSSSPKAFILDMKEVTYVSSMGLSVIFKIKQSLEEKQVSLVIASLQPQIKKVFEIIKVLPEYYFATMEEAEAHMDEFLDEMQRKELDKHKPCS